MYKFSILLITYNQEKYIQETIESILNQTYQNFEIILSDDCSTDNTLDIANNIDDVRIKTYSTPFNVGINGNLNNAIKNAAGDYCIVLGGDDKLRNNYLEKLNNILTDKNIKVIYPQLTVIDQNGKYPYGKHLLAKYENYCSEKRLHDLFIQSNNLPSPGMCVEANALKSLYPLDNSLVIYQDYKIHADLLINGYKHLVLDEIFVEYRQFNDSRNISNNIESIGELRCALDTDTFMDSFLRINNLELLKSVFEREIEETGIQPYENTIPFFLGQMALLSNDRNKQIWGYKQIAKFISIFDNYDLVKNLYDFDFKKFRNLPKQMNVQQEINIIKKKYKKYKMLFNMTVIIAVISVIANILFIIGKVFYGL